MTPTPQQQRAIEALDRSLLLSAAAGSGKTAVLARRCAHIISRSADDAIPACGVENLLVVTFTKAAAQQMRERIADRLASELAAAQEGRDRGRAEHVRREIALLPRAAISTLSSFCAGLVRRHFHAAGVDPHFAVLDEDQAHLLKRQSARAVLDEFYAEEDEAFVELVDLYAEGYDERLIQRLIACHNLLTSVADPDAWRRETRRRVEEGARLPLSRSDVGRAFLQLLVRELRGALESAERLQKESAEAGLAKYAQHVHEHMVLPAAEWVALAEAGDVDALAAAFAGYDKGRLPQKRGNDSSAKNVLQREINAWKDRVTKKDLSVLLRFSGAQWIEGMERIGRPTAAFLSLAEAFEREYARAKAGLRALDFADLERKALDLLLRDPSRPDRLEPSDIALHYQRQFQHVLVDEFQDINEVQDHLLRLLSRETAPPDAPADWRPNLFAVGDVKQSIYRFRLAEPAMFMRRADRADDPAVAGRLERIDLQTNFRSRAPLLGAINAVFSRLMIDKESLDIDYAQRHALAANPDYPEPPANGFRGAPVELHVLEPQGAASDDDDDEPGEAAEAGPEADAREAERIEREATLVAQRIAAFMEEGRTIAGRDGPEPLRYRHVAVLLRARKFNSERFANVLRRSGVPCFSEVGTGFFRSIEVQDVLSLLRVLDNRRQDIPLASVLRSPLVDLPEAEEVLARIRLEHRSRSIPFFEAVVRYARQQQNAVGARLRHVLSQIESWRRLAHRRPLAELLWHVYTESGYLAYVAGLPAGEQRVANLLELHRRAGQFDAFQRQGLGAFMQFLASLEDSGEVGQPPTLSEADDVVRVMSIHAAKGLEFPVVFLADCGKDHNLMDTYGSMLLDRETGLAMQAVDRRKQIRYPSLVHELARRRLRRASLAEELRVLYVAMTRAREHLVCVGTARKDAQREIDRWMSAPAQELTPAQVLAGRTYLDWLGQSAAAMGEHFQVNLVPARQIDDAASRVSGRRRAAPVPEELINLRPFEQAPPADEACTAAIRRLTTPYAFASLASLPAAVGVTRAVADGHDATHEPAGAPADDEAGPMEFAADLFSQPPQRPAQQPAGKAAPRRALSRLPPPRWLEAEAKPSAADVGTATHTVLRLLDFREAASADEVRRQVEEMVGRRQLSADMARRVDAEAIAWLASTDLGRLLARHHDALLRELPVRVPAAPGEVVPGWSGKVAGPMDRILLRGQIDVVVPLESGLVLADYKTDRLRPGASGDVEEALRELLEHYRPQVGHYRRALERLAGRPVSQSWLVLLDARRIERI